MAISIFYEKIAWEGVTHETACTGNRQFFLNEVILRSENQHEILIGHCTSDVALTNTQEHILMLLSKESLTNSELARRLNVSQAAVTKAIKSLVKEGMLETSRDPKDARVVFTN